MSLTKRFLSEKPESARRDAAKKLVRLLEAPEFDCFTWHDAVHEQIEAINVAYGTATTRGPGNHVPL